MERKYCGFGAFRQISFFETRTTISSNIDYFAFFCLNLPGLNLNIMSTPCPPEMTTVKCCAGWNIGQHVFSGSRALPLTMCVCVSGCFQRLVPLLWRSSSHITSEESWWSNDKQRSMTSLSIVVECGIKLRQRVMAVKNHGGFRRQDDKYYTIHKYWSLINKFRRSFILTCW